MSEGTDMAATAAGYLADGEFVLVGVGAPGRAASLAQRSHAPGLTLVYESGAVGSVPAAPPLSIGDPTLFAGALAAMSVGDVFSFVIEGGMIDTAFVGAAEIDRHARLNSTVVGDYGSPEVRLPGSGGACEIVEHARRLLVLSPLQRRRFPAEVGFVTSAPRPGTEVIVVTERCVLRRGRDEEELKLDRLLGEATREEVEREIGWDLRPSERFEREKEGAIDIRTTGGLTR